MNEAQAREIWGPGAPEPLIKASMGPPVESTFQVIATNEEHRVEFLIDAQQGSGLLGFIGNALEWYGPVAYNPAGEIVQWAVVKGEQTVYTIAQEIRADILAGVANTPDFAIFARRKLDKLRGFEYQFAEVQFKKILTDKTTWPPHLIKCSSKKGAKNFAKVAKKWR